MTITLRKSGQSNRSDVVYKGDVITHQEMDANFEHLVSVNDDLTPRIVSLENSSLNLSAASPQLTYDNTTGELTYTQDDTDTVAEGSTNLYYTDDRVDTYLTTNNYATKLYVTTSVQNAVFGASLATVATSGDYTDLTNTPNFATVATSGDYTDLTNTPTTLSTFTNDSNYITLTDLSVSGDLAYDNTTGVISYTQPTNISTFTNDSAYLVDADIRSEFTDITDRLATLETPTYTIFDVFRNQYDNNTGGYTVPDEAISFYIRALDTFRLNWLASGQTDPSWDSLVDDIEDSDVSGVQASFSSMPTLDQTVFLLPMVFLLNAQIKIINEALGTSYTNLTFDILANSFSAWESTNSGFEADAATFEGSLNTTNTSFITGLLKNNSYDDFTADKVVTGWNPV